MTRLIDEGESKIIKNTIYDVFPNLKSSHDDAVIIDVNDSESIVVSTDPCPEPIICKFDTLNRYYHYGRMSVLINYSDIAAMGAKPIGILLSTIMPNDMLVEDYKQFLSGVKEACQEWGGNLLGGNVKEGAEFSVTGTSIGRKISDRLMTRVGSNLGDAVCITGDLGMFWLSILKLIDGNSLDKLDVYTKSFAISPFPKVEEGMVLAKSGKVTACMDNSDGIIGCLYELSQLNNVTIRVNNELLKPNYLLETYCSKKQIDFRNLMLSWGGWDLVFTCPLNYLSQLSDEFKTINKSFHVIGKVVEKVSYPVILNDNDEMYYINDFSSKRFDKSSYFTYGIEASISQLFERQIRVIDKL